MEKSNESVTVVIIDSSRVLMALDIPQDTAATVLALASDDPANWDEAVSVWARYRTPAVCEFADELPFELTSYEKATQGLAAVHPWVTIDFTSLRIFTGGGFTRLGRNAEWMLGDDGSNERGIPLSIHLPPWWELHEGSTLEAIDQPRANAIAKPVVDRDVLYGTPFLQDIASRVLAVFATEEWRTSDAMTRESSRYPFTVQVHRDWLMTPRLDLGGRMPRQLLHGAIEWSDAVVWGQHLRLQQGVTLQATPDDWPGFATAPMGSQEMCLYFDLCRQVIEASWCWCVRHGDGVTQPKPSSSSETLVAHLQGVVESWLSEAFEGDAAPHVMIECDRRRVPCEAGMAIEGIGEVQTEEHIVDCDCPICEMMAEGEFGIGFTSIDGHHLELDDEFAFSMIESREDWEAQMETDAELHAGMNSGRSERKESDEPQDPFAPIWSSFFTDEAIPGDTRGMLKMAVMVAELLSDLSDLEASREDIEELKDRFAKYRQSQVASRTQHADRLKSSLQSLALRYPSLVSKSADLQSRIDESERSERST
jgi:hypothetical protein